MKIVSIGMDINHKNVSNIDFRSPVSLLDFDMLIFNPSKIFYEYQTQYGSPTYMGWRCLDDDDSSKIVLIYHEGKMKLLNL